MRRYCRTQNPCTLRRSVLARWFFMMETLGEGDIRVDIVNCRINMRDWINIQIDFVCASKINFPRLPQTWLLPSRTTSDPVTAKHAGRFHTLPRLAYPLKSMIHCFFRSSQSLKQTSNTHSKSRACTLIPGWDRFVGPVHAWYDQPRVLELACPCQTPLRVDRWLMLITGIYIPTPWLGEGMTARKSFPCSARRFTIIIIIKWCMAQNRARLPPETISAVGGVHNCHCWSWSGEGARLPAGINPPQCGGFVTIIDITIMTLWKWCG